MKQLITSLFKNQLISGSTIAFIGSFSTSFLAYIFNLAMIRMLPVSDYGLLTTLTSLTVVFGIFQLSLIGIFAKFSAKYSATNDTKGFSQLYTSGIKFVVFFAGVLLTVLLSSIPVFTQMLKIEYAPLLIIIFISIASSVVSSFPLGVLQGRMQFTATSLLYLSSAITKVILGVAFVKLGFGLIGALVAILIASLVIVGIGMIFIKEYHTYTHTKTFDSSIFFNEFKKYSVYFFLASLGITIITNADIMLVRAFFVPEISGQYAALSLMGKAIFYFTSPIYFVFFPLIAQKYEKKENYTQILVLTIVIITGITGAISLFYHLFPQIILRIFAPLPEYQMLVPYIGLFSMYMVIFSIANIFNHLFLSLNKVRVYIINLFVAVVFIGSITIFHKSLYDIIFVLLSSASLLLVLYILYYYRVRNEKY